MLLIDALKMMVLYYFLHHFYYENGHSMFWLNLCLSKSLRSVLVFFYSDLVWPSLRLKLTSRKWAPRCENRTLLINDEQITSLCFGVFHNFTTYLEVSAFVLTYLQTITQTKTVDRRKLYIHICSKCSYEMPFI